MMNDLRAYGTGSNHTRQQLLQMRALNPNILADEKKWDEQIEAQRVAEGGAVAYCVHPSVHAETQSLPWLCIRRLAGHQVKTKF